MRAVDAVTESARRFAEPITPYKTGRLRRSLYSSKARKEGRFIVGRFGASVPYAAIQEDRYNFLGQAAKATFPRVGGRMRRGR